MSDDESDRLYTPCEAITSKFTPEQLIVTCSRCTRFYSRCCHHMRTICHHRPIIYIDGACSNNGRAGAVTGIGIAFGTHDGDPDDADNQQFSIPVDDWLDPGGRRTSQCTELLAALEGLKKICDADEDRMADQSELEEEDEDPSPVTIIVTTESEYVVKGMSGWLPNWKRNGLRKSNGQRPSNPDLFIKLDAEVEARERRHDCKIQFWHIDRAHNTIADQLAKNGARAAACDVNEALVECFSGIAIEL